MKKTFSIALALALASTANATDYFTEGTVWEVVYDDDSQPTPTYVAYNYYIEGDTVIAGLDCLKMWSACQTGNSTKELATCIYKDGERVYFFPHKASSEKALLYDFALQPEQRSSFALPKGQWTDKGDCIENDVRCDYLYQIKQGVATLEAMHVTEFATGQATTHSQGGTWIKGIGSLRGVLENIGFDMDGGSSWLSRVTHNGETIYSNDMPTYIKQVKATQRTQGKYRLDGKLAMPDGKGIYIVNGRKVLGQN